MQTFLFVLHFKQFFYAIFVRYTRGVGVWNINRLRYGGALCFGLDRTSEVHSHAQPWPSEKNLFACKVSRATVVCMRLHGRTEGCACSPSIGILLSWQVQLGGERRANPNKFFLIQTLPVGVRLGLTANLVSSSLQAKPARFQREGASPMLFWLGSTRTARQTGLAGHFRATSRIHRAGGAWHARLAGTSNAP